MAFNYSPKIVTDGLVLYLDAANPRSYPGSGTAWNDLSRGGSNGTLVNGPTFSSANGGSIVFDRVNDYINIPYSGSTSNSFTFTIAMECANMDSNLANRQTLFGLAENGNFAYQQFDVEIWGNSGRGFRGDGVNFSGYSWTPGVDTNNNTIYTVTLNSNGQSIYINGQLRNTINQAVTASFNSITLGIRGSGGNPWGGSCYSFSMYNRELSQQEILQNYNATKTRFGL